MPAKKAGASGTPAKKAGGIRDASQESRVHVEEFSACIRLFYVHGSRRPAG